MTINQLHKLLAKLIAQGHGRKAVYVDKWSYRDNRESDGCVILPVSIARMQTYMLLDDDGGCWENKDGTERTRKSLVLLGESGSTADDHMPPVKRKQQPSERGVE